MSSARIAVRSFFIYGREGRTRGKHRDQWENFGDISLKFYLLPVDAGMQKGLRIW